MDGPRSVLLEQIFPVSNITRHNATTEGEKKRSGGQELSFILFYDLERSPEIYFRMVSQAYFNIFFLRDL